MRPNIAAASLVCALLLAGDGLSTMAQGADPVRLEDLVFVTEDNARRLDGCDGISVFNVPDGRPVYRGKTFPSPGRISASADFSVVIANYTSGGGITSGPFLYLMKGDLRDREHWAVSVLPVERLAPLAAVAILPDNDTLLVSTYDHTDDFFGRYPEGPYLLEKYLLSEVSNAKLGPLHGAIEITAPAVAFFPSQSDAQIHVVTGKSVVHTIDVVTMLEGAAAIRMAGIPTGVGGLGSVMRQAHATISADGRYIVMNLGAEDDLAVADLVDRRTWTLPMSGYSGGVAFNRGWINRGLLAVHTGGTIRVYRFDPTGPLVQVGQIAIKRPSMPDCEWGNADCQVGPVASLAWSASGDRLIAASENEAAEFIVIDVEGEGTALRQQGWLTACPDRDAARPGEVPFMVYNWPNHILTANGFVSPTPTVTATPPETATIPSATTDVPSPTVSGTTSATATHSPTITTATPTPTASATGLLSSTPTRVASRTPTPTDTAPNGPLYLPLALVEQCPPENVFTDVALVIDASMSMLDQTADRRRKIDVAVEAVAVFLDGLGLGPDRNRAAIVVFNKDGQTLQQLTDQRSRLDTALSRIRIESQSRVDLGLERATTEILARGRPGQVQAIVLLSDGKADQAVGDRAIAAARRAQGAGVVVYVVGMGPSMDERVLRGLASGSTTWFPAPNPLSIRRIYQDLTRRVPCPPGAYWGRR